MENSDEDFVEDQFDLAFDVFERLIYPPDKEDGVMCSIHESFGIEKSKSHNCLGCNFEESTHQIYMFLTIAEGHKDINLAFTNYIFLLYILVERIEVIWEIIALPDNYKQKHFRVFQRVKKWANFIKHPKAFVLCHHPSFVLANDPIWEDSNKNELIIIDDEFVNKYYSSGNNKTELFNKIANKSNVVVKIPDLVELTDSFAQGLLKFADVIDKNEVYRELLNDKSTIRDYFSEDTDVSEK